MYFQTYSLFSLNYCLYYWISCCFYFINRYPTCCSQSVDPLGGTKGCTVPGLVEIGPVVLEKKIFKGQGRALHLYKLESPLHKDALCQVWLKLVQWFLRRRFLHFVNVILLFHNCFPLEKCGALHLNKSESHLPNDNLCQIWLKLTMWFWRRRWKCEKFTTTMTTMTTDNG